jgi:hypothetical protein
MVTSQSTRDGMSETNTSAFSTAEIIGHLDKLTPKGGSFVACGSDVPGMILAGGGRYGSHCNVRISVTVPEIFGLTLDMFSLNSYH